LQVAGNLYNVIHKLICLGLAKIETVVCAYVVVLFVLTYGFSFPGHTSVQSSEMIFQETSSTAATALLSSLNSVFHRALHSEIDVHIIHVSQ